MAEATTIEHERAGPSSLDGVDLVRVREALGRADTARRLFDFLVAASRKNWSPREIDIAIEVFGRTKDFDMSQDASVRVYVHRLRRKLDEFYAGAGRDEPARLTIPKGEYRIEVKPTSTPPVVAAAVVHVTRRPWFRLLAALAVLAVINILVWLALWPRPATDALAPVRASPLWSMLLTDKRPITLAVGDYYIFGETDGGMNVTRLVREFSINSREELYEFLMNHPQFMDRYQDMDLRYLPISISHALGEILPVLQASGGKKVQIVLASEITPELMKSSHIVYIGLLSGLGALRDPVFSGSRYSIGDTYDELIDNQTGKKYISQLGDYSRSNSPTLDYGMLATFDGPTGNRFIVIAGTRDVAVRQIAEEAANHASLGALTKEVKDKAAYEALYEVGAMHQLNIDAKLLNVTALNAEHIWSTGSAQHFPSE